MRRFFMLLLAPLMFAGSFQATAAAPKADLDQLEFAGAQDQNTPVLLGVASHPVPFRGADGRVHIDYELQVINARAVPARLVSMEVLDAASGKVLATVSGADIARTFSLLSAPPPTTWMPRRPASSGSTWCWSPASRCRKRCRTAW